MGYVRKVARIERPEGGILKNRARGDCQVDLAMPWPLQTAVDVGGERRFSDAEGARGLCRQQHLLGVQLVVGTRSAPPFIEHDRRDAEAFAVRHEPSKDLCVGTRS